jgi:hypothetical protein
MQLHIQESYDELAPVFFLDPKELKSCKSLLSIKIWDFENKNVWVHKNRG